MEKDVMRLVDIEIKNFKNIKNGTLNFINKRKKYRTSVVGLYGQNGSGKTALIDAIMLLKYVLSGRSVPKMYTDYINVESEFAELKYQFVYENDEELYKIWYRFSLKKTADEDFMGSEEEAAVSDFRAEVFDEVLEYSYMSSQKKIRKCVLIDTNTTGVFVPKAKYKEFINGACDTTDLLVTKRLMQAQSKSFVFSPSMIKIYKEHCQNRQYLLILQRMMLYGVKDLFVIATENSGLISMNTLPLTFKYREKNSEMVGSIMLPLDKSMAVAEREVTIVKKIIENMNIVLEQIVPGLTIGIIDLGGAVSKNGEAGRQIQLVSLKNNKEISFQYESEGIKKIVSVLQLLIAVYNSSSVTVVIDELDSGIFEYLLGEILNIISEKGKGQLIFTSHNLRPLETIDKGFVAFTTTNSENRYIRMTNVKENNNLRDFYYRDIILGEQSEQVYESTNNFEIALAFREAGEVFGS